MLLDDYLKKIDIVLLTETWSSDSTVTDAMLGMNRYTVYRCDRDSHGGGTAILVRDTIPSVALFSQSFSSKCQIVSCRVEIDSRQYCVICVYRSPSCERSHFIEGLRYIEEFSVENNDSLIIGGDFNCKEVDWIRESIEGHSLSSSDLLDFALSANLTQHVLSPTRMDNILDIVLTSEEDTVQNVNIAAPILRMDHCIVHFTICGNHSNVEPEYRLDYGKADWESACRHIASIDWPSLLLDSDPNSLYDKFCSLILEIVRATVPISKRRREVNNTSSRVDNLLRRTEKLYRKRHIIGVSHYKESDKKLKRLIKSERREKEWRMVQSKHKIDLFKFSSRVVKNKQDGIGTLEDGNGVSVTNDERKAQLLASSFSATYTERSFEEPTLSTRAPAILDWVSFTPSTVYKALARLPNKVSTSPDSIPYIVLRNCALPLALPLTIIFDRMILCGRVPGVWREAIVRPVYKSKGERSSPLNYRPISLTCGTSKLMERMVCREIQNFLEKNSLSCQHQHGFISRRSCLTSIVTTLKDFQYAVDRGSFVSVVYIDYTKAFDIIPIPLLLHKCRSIGIEGSLLRWIEAFLTERKQRVKVGNCLSNEYKASSGVPQGSVIGPLLFSIYIADIGKFLPEGVHYSLYADDAKVYTVNDCALLQRGLDCLSEWSTRWGMTISKTKTVCMKIGRKHPDHSFYIHGSQLEEVDTFRDLGVRYSNDLSFDAHVDDICRNAMRRCGYILRSFVSRSPKLYGMLFNTYVRPVLEYCSEVWNDQSIGNRDKIERTQRKYTRMCLKKCSLPYMEYRERLNQFSMECLHERRKRADLIFAHKIMNGAVNIDAKNYFNIANSEVNLRGNGQRINLHMYRSSQFQKAHCNRVVTSWNSLPSHIVRTTSLLSFKRALSAHLSHNN